MSDWDSGAYEDDVRPRMLALAAGNQAFALATIIAADGGPRPVGSQMVISGDEWWGFLSGGCIEADVARHGRGVLDGAEPRLLIYGKGSPWIDLRLPCGGRIEVFLERVAPGDDALKSLTTLTASRQPARWRSNGIVRRCHPASTIVAAQEKMIVDLAFGPVQQLVVVGSDPFALAMAAQGLSLGWATFLVSPFGPDTPPSLPVVYHRSGIETSLSEIAVDRWTAVAVATHDRDVDERALTAALATDAGYIGVLGSRRRLPDRLASLRAIGASDEQLDRIHAPIGLSIGAVTPREVAVAVAGEIIASNAEANARFEPSAAHYLDQALLLSA